MLNEPIKILLYLLLWNQAKSGKNQVKSLQGNIMDNALEAELGLNVHCL